MFVKPYIKKGKIYASNSNNEKTMLGKLVNSPISSFKRKRLESNTIKVGNKEYIRIPVFTENNFLLPKIEDAWATEFDCGDKIYRLSDYEIENHKGSKLLNGDSLDYVYLENVNFVEEKNAIT